MKNKKLQLINELLWEFDSYRTSIDDLQELHKRILVLKNSYPKEYVYYKILDFISIEIHFTIEELFENDEVVQL